MRYAFILLALAASASGQQPPIAVTNSPPPPLVGIPVAPPFPSVSQPRPPAPHIVRPPQWRLPIQAYVTPDDYPASARARGEQGWVAFTLQVWTNGRAHG